MMTKLTLLLAGLTLLIVGPWAVLTDPAPPEPSAALVVAVCLACVVAGGLLVTWAFRGRDGTRRWS